MDEHTSNTMPRITLRISDSLLSALEARAATEHRRVANMATRILSLELNVLSSEEELDESTNPQLPLG